VPRLEAKWEFIDDHGATIWQTTDHYDFKHAASKYFIKSKPGYDNTMAGGRSCLSDTSIFREKNRARRSQADCWVMPPKSDFPSSFRLAPFYRRAESTRRCR